MKINNKIPKKYVIHDQNGNSFGMLADKVVEERERDFVCITLYLDKKLVGRFYDYSSIVPLEERIENGTLH